MTSASTLDEQYTQRLDTLQSAWWKRLLRVQAPYAWNLRRMKLGFFLDIGCGIGRNLSHVNGHGVGIDHNSHSVHYCREAGLEAYTTSAFKELPSERRTGFDSLLFAHLMEHLDKGGAKALLKEYLPCVKKGGRVLIITPQERGFESDPTHVEFMDFATIASMAKDLGLEVERQFSFPFPRSFGRWFIYNEFVTILKSRDLPPA